jgi:hypothetical protein
MSDKPLVQEELADNIASIIGELSCPTQNSSADGCWILHRVYSAILWLYLMNQRCFIRGVS